MHNQAVIHLITALGKVAVDYTDLSDNKKELIKTGIDIVAIFLTQLNECEQNKRQKCVWDRQSIKTCAKENGLDKIVIFPYPLKNGENVALIKMYGGNIQQFSSSIGIILLNDKISENSEIEHYERTYGKVFYQCGVVE